MLRNKNIEIPTFNIDVRVSRSKTNGELKISGKTNGTQATFINDSKVKWNIAPLNVTSCPSLYSAKKAIKSWVKNLPL